MSSPTVAPHDGRSLKIRYSTGDLSSQFCEEQEITQWDKSTFPEPSATVFKINTLETRVRNIESIIEKIAEKEVVYKEPVIWKKEDAKKAITKLFEETSEVGYSDIMEKLGINLDLIIEICEELEKEKRIEEIKS